MLGHLRVAALGALGKSHDPLHPGGRLAGITRKQVVDDRSGAGVDREQLDPHRPAGVVAAPHDPCLLEHADEDARVVVAGRQLRRVDGAAEIADRPVHAPQVVRPGMSPTANRRTAVASDGLASNSVSLGAPSRPPRPTICT